MTTDTPISRADLATMSPAEINQAHAAGKLDHILAGHDKARRHIPDERIAEALEAGTIHHLIADITRTPEDTDHADETEDDQE